MVRDRGRCSFRGKEYFKLYVCTGTVVYGEGKWPYVSTAQLETKRDEYQPRSRPKWVSTSINWLIIYSQNDQTKTRKNEQQAKTRQTSTTGLALFHRAHRETTHTQHTLQSYTNTAHKDTSTYIYTIYMTYIYNNPTALNTPWKRSAAWTKMETVEFAYTIPPDTLKIN